MDTDQIIPARFLKATSREGFGDNLFRDWRFDEQGHPKPDFVLNDPTYSGCILVADANFGCGSSREHAAWAVYDYGFRVVVSTSFADIFKNNALNNGILPIEVSERFLKNIFLASESNPQSELRVNLESQSITLVGSGEKEYFEIGAYKKHCLQNGLDDIDYLLSVGDEIAQFEKSRERVNA